MKTREFLRLTSIYSEFVGGYQLEPSIKTEVYKKSNQHGYGSYLRIKKDVETNKILSIRVKKLKR